MNHSLNEGRHTQYQHSLNHAIVEVATQLLTLQADTQDTIIASALQRLGTRLGVDRAYVFRFSDDLDQMSNTYEWCAEGIEPQRERIQNMPTDALPWWKKKMMQNTPVLISAVNEMPPEAQAEREEFSSQGIQSLVCFPLIDQRDHLIGFMGFDAVCEPRSWSEQEMDLLVLTAHLLAVAMGRSWAEEATRENAELLARSQEIAHLGSWKLDVSANHLRWSDEVYRIFGCTPQEFEATYESFLSFVHPDDRAAVDEAYTRSIREGRSGYEIEHRIIRKSTGEERHVHEQCIHEVDDAGAVIRSVGMVHDITERKRVERYHALAAEILSLLNQTAPIQDLLQTVLGAIRVSTGCDAVGIRLLRGEDFPYFVQNGFSSDFLLAENTLIARDPQDGICRGPDGKVSLECTCGLVISGKTDPSNPLFSSGGSAWTNDSMPFLDLSADADPRLHPRNRCIHEGYASIALIPIRTRQKIVGLLHINHRKKNQFSDEVIQLLEGIAAHIGEALIRVQMEKDREKLQAQLFQAQKMDSIGRLAGGVAHDFNNMLTIILGEAEIAMETAGDNDQLRTILDEIQKAAKRSADLTRQLLAFARKATVVPKVLDLNETVDGMLKMLRRLIGEDIDLVWRPGSNLYPVSIDPAQVDQMLANLCVNARDAITEAGKITVETDNVSIDEDYCAKHAEALPGDFVMLAVSDNGRGMAPEVLDQVFEPFFTTKVMGKGIGLGLAAVYGGVKQNNGFINAYSEPGHGTTFKIYLPRHTTRTTPKTVQRQDATPKGHCETILLVEDEPAILKTITRLLEELGYTVLPASSPGEAMRLAREHKGDIDLLITDVIMPEMNGRDLARNLVSIFPDMKRLFMSGYTANVIVHHGVLDAGVHFLQKPFSRYTLASKIREALD